MAAVRSRCVLPFHGAVDNVLLREFDKLGVEFGGQHRVVAVVCLRFDVQVIRPPARMWLSGNTK